MGKLSFGEYILDTQTGRLYHQDKALDLEPQIYGILELLITRHGEVVSRDDIIDAVWGGRLVSNNVIDNRIKSVRAAIGDSGRAQRFIKTYPNRGYKFIGEIRVGDEISQAMESISSTSQPEAETTTLELPLSKDTSFLQKSTALKVAALAVVGMFGFFILSQSTRSEMAQSSSAIDSNDEAAVYKLATSDDPKALPRVAVLPFEAVGDKSDFEYLPEILRSEFNNTITAIDGITVVGLSSGTGIEESLKDYKILKEAFGLDYVIDVKLLSYGNAIKLNVSLIEVEDGDVLYNESFDLDISEAGGLNDSPATIARKVTLITANKLSLSVDNLPKSWENYDFYKKYEEALEISASKDYESVKKGISILREVIDAEPSFILAYSKLHEMLSWQFVFLADDHQVLLKEQTEINRKMNEISPDAPETLINNAHMDSTDGGVGKTSMGEFVPNDPVSVARYILEKDPDNQLGHLTLAVNSSFVTDLAATIKAYEDVLRLMPTDATMLSGYSSALYCNAEIDKAREVLDRASHWHPGHRDVLTKQMLQARARGEYDVALRNSKSLLDKGYITYKESYGLSSLFFDLGHPEGALPHIRFEPIKAHIYAVLGDKEAALKEAEVYDTFYTSIRARMIADEAYFPENYSVNRTYRNVGKPDDETKAHSCRLHHLVRDTYVLKKIKSEKFELFLPLLIEYFADKNVEDFVLQRDYTALMGLYLLQDNPDKAIEVLDIAIERGFLFIGTLKEPYLRDLRSHPGFTARLEAMRNSADLLIEKYYGDKEIDPKIVEVAHSATHRH